jgi:NAD(P)-dependent dehydrogenase (short-subunit alcohol dehydrogenase family)
LDAGGTSLELDRRSVVLATGGGRGITAEACIALAEHGQATFVLLGRTSAPPESEEASTTDLTDEAAIKRALLQQLSQPGNTPTPRDLQQAYVQLMRERELRTTMARLRATGARVDYRTCDVQDAVSFEQLIDDVYLQYGRIDGVIHGAGIIEDRLMEDKSLESFRRVVRTKLDPAEVLERKLRPESLQFMAFFSSITARAGNRGQTDYAAANEALNKLAQSLDRKWPGRVVAFNWGPWSEAGMVTPEARRQFEERNVGLIPVRTGRAMFLREVLFGAKGEVEVTIAGIAGQAQGPHNQQAASSSEMGGLTTLPLLGPQTETASEGGTTRLSRTLSLEHDRYLKHHVLGDRPVLPFAFATEMMAEAAKLSAPQKDVLSVSDIRVLHGIVMDTPEVALEVTARQQHKAGAGDGKMAPVDVTIAQASDSNRVSYRATVELGSGHNSTSVFASAIERCSKPLAGAGPLPVTIEEAYENWLFHGPLFQAIRSIEAIGPDGVSGALQLSDPKECLSGSPEGAWLIDPILLDAAFQMQLLWGRVHWDVTLLPSTVQSYVCLNEIGKTGLRAGDIVRCELRSRPEAKNPISHTDIVFFDGSGAPIGAVIDLEGTGSETLNRMVGAGNWRGL